MNKKIKQHNAFTLAEGGHSLLLYGDVLLFGEGVVTSN